MHFWVLCLCSLYCCNRFFVWCIDLYVICRDAFVAVMCLLCCLFLHFVSGIEAPSVQGGEILAVVVAHLFHLSELHSVDRCIWRLRQLVIKHGGGDGDIDHVVSNYAHLIYHLLQHVDEDGREKNSSTEAEDKTWWISMWFWPDSHVIITNFDFAKQEKGT